MTIRNMIYNIPEDKEFFQTLHDEILVKLVQRSKEKSVIILLPTNFACASLRKIISKADCKRLRIYSISNLEELVDLNHNYIVLSRIGMLTQISNILLTMNLAKFQELSSITPLAEYFANFIQNIEAQQANLNDIIKEIDEDLSIHQQELFSILKEFIVLWQRKNFISKSGYNNLLIEKLANNIGDQVIIMAGISYDTSSIIKLMKNSLEKKGSLVFYGIDSNLTESDWNNIDLSHSQYNFKQIFAKLNISIKEIKNIDHTESCLISQALKPAKSCADWYKISNFEKLPNIQYLKCMDLHHEAQSIISILKNTSSPSIMIVTADDALMVKIILHLKSANIDANIIRDYPLEQSREGTWLKLCLNLLKERFSLLSSLALLKHPFANIDQETVQQIEEFIRNKNFHGNSIFDIDIEDEKFNLIIAAVKNIKTIYSAKPLSFQEMLRAHIAFAQEIANQELWECNEGAELKNYLKQIEENAVGYTKNYFQIFNHYIKTAYYRPESNEHSITLLKPIDARLHKADLVILAGLNEGIWPAEVKIDPCLNRSILKKMNMKQAEQSIGEEAYDFQCHAQSKQVIITRSERISGVITSPSRWLLRMLTLSRNVISPFTFPEQSKPVSISKIRENSHPCPPLEFRPTQLSVTQIDKLIFNPYHIYVDEILKLKKLPALKKELSALDFGIFVHRALEIYHHKRKTPNLEILLESGKQALIELHLNQSKIELIYWTRFLRIAKWFVNTENPSNKAYLEAFGKMQIGVNFTLKAKADRIEIAADNSLIVIDYKTGNLPSAKAINTGKNLQLLLEGMLSKNGKFFFQKGPQEIKSLMYIGLSGGDEPVEILEIDLTEKNLIEDAEKYVSNLIEQYQDPTTSYHYTKSKKLGYCEYEHLARKF